MKRFWYIFKSYYVTYIFVYVIIMFIMYFIDNANSNINRFKFLLVFVFVFMLLMSSIEFIKHEYYKKWLIKRLLDKTPLIEFLSHNFLKHENFIVGELRGYTVVVGIDWQKHQDRYGYYYQVLFDPFINGRMLNLKECKSFQEEIIKNKLNFNLNSIDKFYGKRKVFLRKEHKDILSDIYDTIEWLMLRNFKPISFIEWIDSFSKASRHSETFYTK